MENKLHYGLFYIRCGIEYTKVKLCDEKEDLCFDTRIINSNFLFDKKRNLTVYLTTYKFVYLTGHLTTCKFVD